MNQYQFESIHRVMGKRFGKIPRGKESEWNAVFFILDSNVLKVHRRVPSANNYRLREALLMALHVIQNRLDGKDADPKDFENTENRLLCDAILSACDPYSNEDLMHAVSVKSPTVLEDPAFKQEIYAIPVKCIVRMIDSVDFWTKLGGINGYFQMVEREIGTHVENDGKMNYLITLRKE